MFKYLNALHPNTYVKKTKFGDVVYCPHYDTHFSSAVYIDNIDKLKMMFSCNRDFCKEVHDDWILSLPTI